jgi:hypothetical protein
MRSCATKKSGDATRIRKMVPGPTARHASATLEAVQAPQHSRSLAEDYITQAEVGESKPPGPPKVIAELRAHLDGVVTQKHP